MSHNVLIIFAHPALHRSQINKRMLAAVRNLDGVVVNNLYEMYPDFFIDVKREQQLLLSADLVVLHHPFYWYNAPAIIKEWLDVVLERGFAYGSGGTALHGKDLMLAISTGGTAETYSPNGVHGFAITELLRPFEQTARFCGMQYHPPFLIQGSSEKQHDALNKHARNYFELLKNYVQQGKNALQRSS